MIPDESYIQVFQWTFSCTNLFFSSSVVESFSKRACAGMLIQVDFSVEVWCVYRTAFLMTQEGID